MPARLVPVAGELVDLLLHLLQVALADVVDAGGERRARRFGAEALGDRDQPHATCAPGALDAGADGVDVARHLVHVERHHAASVTGCASGSGSSHATRA